MSIEIRVPPLPESVSEAELLSWHKQVGDPVRRDENLVDLETDKVVLEIPSPVDGVLEEIIVPGGSSVENDTLIARISEVARTSKTPAPVATPVTTAQTTAQTAAAPPNAPEPTPTQAQVADKASNNTVTPLTSPAVRALIADHHLDATQIPATGRGGRLTKTDVLDWLQQQDAANSDPVSTPESIPESPAPKSAAPTSPAPEPALPSAEDPLESRPKDDTAQGERREPMSRLRQRIAERLVEAQQTTASLTTFNEVNMQAVMDLRAKHKDAFEKQHGVRLGFMSFFVKASIEALRRYPLVNASIEDDHIVHHDYYDIGIAVASPRGLVVPVLRDADQLSFAETEAGIRDYGSQARDGSLGLEDITGGTFTITNGGVFGSLLSTPILNPPQSGILGMHKIEQRPVAENGEVVIRPIMYLALTYDHRIIDGADAVRFLVTIKECLEDPARLLLHV